ncbi:MAG: hypothetical protein V4677_07995 [Bacteroidota bacterium]
MKIILSIIIAGFLTVTSFGQTKNLFYASPDDYKNAKPIAGYEIEDGSFFNGNFGAGFKVKNGGDATKTKLSELPSQFFTYNYNSDWLKFNDRLMRSYKGDVYVIIVNGPICYYYAFPFPEKQYYSETISGDLKRYDRDVIEKYCKQYDLLEDYKTNRPKIKGNTTAEERIDNNMQYDIKYFGIINSKMKP